MSGRKYSQVELQRTVQDTINCRLEAQQAVQEANSFVMALGEQLSHTPSLSPLFKEAQENVRAISNELEELNEVVNSSSMMNMTSEQVRNHKQVIEKLSNQLATIKAQCMHANEAASLHTRVASILNRLMEYEEELRPWFESYHQLLEDTNDLLAQINQTISKTGKLDNYHNAIAKSEMNYNAMSEAVKSNQKAYDERQYIASAIENVCSEMGFEVTRIVSQNPLDDLHLKVNTFAYGQILFKLELNGNIQSESETIESSSCPMIYPDLERMLQNLGVNTRFLYQDDQLPIRIEKGSNSMPQDDDGHHNEMQA